MPTPADLDRLKIDRGAGAAGGGRRKRARRSPWIARAVWLAILLGALWLFRRPLTGLVDRLRLPEVTVARAVKRSPAAAAALSGAAANGYVVARVQAALSADTAGRLVELNVAEGSQVRAGEVVARLYFDEFAAAAERARAEVALGEAGVTRTAADIESAERALAALRSQEAAALASVAEAQADVDFAQKDHARVARLVQNDDVSESRLDEALRALDGARARHASAGARHEAARSGVAEGEARLASARAAAAEAAAGLAVRRASLDQALATLEKTYVRAPFDGIVVRKDAEVGEVVSPASQGGSSLTRGSVVTMVDLSSLEVQAEVPETTLTAVRVGAPARIFLDAYPGEPYAGRIDRIWPIADRQKATIEVRVAFEALDARLRPEMGVRVVFLDGDGEGDAAAAAQQTAEPVVTVPTAARVKVDGADGAFVVERDVVRFVPLTFGEERSGRVVVERGLEGEEVVVLDPPGRLADGERVRTKE